MRGKPPPPTPVWVSFNPLWCGKAAGGLSPGCLAPISSVIRMVRFRNWHVADCQHWVQQSTLCALGGDAA